MKLKLKHQLILLLALILSVILLFTGLTYFTLKNSAETTQNNSDQVLKLNQLQVKNQKAQLQFQRQVQEWKNILLRGNESDLYTKHLDAFEKRGKEFQEILKDAKSELKVLNINLSVDVIITEHKTLVETYKKALLQYDIADYNSAYRVDKILRGIDRKLSKEMEVFNDGLSKVVSERITQVNTQNETLIQQNRINFIIASAISFLLILILSTSIFVKIISSIGSEPYQLSKLFNDIAAGDLTNDMNILKGDNKSAAARAQIMIIRLRSMIAAIHEGVEEMEAFAADAEKTDNASDMRELIKKSRRSILGIDTAANRFKIKK